MSYPRTRAEWMLILALVVISVGTTLSAKRKDTFPKNKCPEQKCHQEKITCAEGQKSIDVNVEHKNGGCYCTKTNCLMISCKHFKFDKNSPIVCENPCEKANEVNNCGCKTWKCERKECEETKHAKCKTESCWDMTSEVDSCGCSHRTCNAPAVVHDCHIKKPCQDQCQECNLINWPNEKCYNETGVRKWVCQHKKCDDLPKCTECEEAVDTIDPCKCPKRECKKVTVRDYCKGNCPDAQCKVMPNRACKNTTVKICEICPPFEKKPCRGKCEEPKTTIDHKGCPIQTCEVHTADGQSCNNCDSVCNDCVEQVYCTTDDGRKASRMQCVPKRDKYANCTECQSPTTTTHPTCGFTLHGCTEKTCEVSAPPDCKSVGKCPKKVKAKCNCDVVKCVDPPVKNNNGERPPKPANACTKKCSTCHSCKWVWDPTCEIWGESCERGCAPYRIPDTPECYEDAKVDGCGCTIPGAQKACPKTPRAPCPKDKPLTVEGKDDCGCPSKTCFPCPKLGPKVKIESDCGECEDFEANEAYTPECLRGVCNRKACPPMDNRDCGDCKVAKTKRDKCGCQTSECVKIACKPPTPKICGAGEVQQLSRNSCGCKENVCVKVEILCEDPPCDVPPPECKCQQTCQQFECEGECVAH